MGLVPFGKVVRAHGLAGGVKILPFSHDVKTLFTLHRLFIQTGEDRSPQELKIVARKVSAGAGVVELEGIDSVETAEQLRGRLVMVEASDLPETDEDEFYWFQLIGLGVYTEQGNYIGKVENLIDREPQSLLVVKAGEKEYLIPMVDTIVKEINLTNSRIIISPVEGLVE